MGKEVIGNAMKSYNCCLFAYGQTESEKSYSMVGYGKNHGIVPMACNDIFNRIQTDSDSLNRNEVYFSMLEI